MAPPADTNDPRWQLTLQVVNSSQFEKSQRLRSFLTYICELELTGRRLEINEQQIGVNVFGRQPGYNPGDDSIVRSQARFLRQRLEEYFRITGPHQPMRIVIPKGSYIPVFEVISAAAPEPLPSPDLAIQPDAASVEFPGASLPEGVADERKKRRRIIAISFTAAVVLCLVLILLFRHSPPIFESPETRFWNAVFDPRRPQVIVPADSTLILIEELTGQPVSFQSYLSRDYLAKMALPKLLTTLNSSDLENSHYTSMADLNLVARIVRVPQLKQLRAEIRYARDLSISDAKEDNLILIGGPRANPWVELFASHMNFYVDYNWQTRQNSVINKAPRNGESPLYAENSSDAAHRVYGLIAFEPSLDREGDALLVAGTSSAGTQSAADFLLTGRSFGEFLRQIERKDGSIPHFELLLEARSLGGNVPSSNVVAYRFVR
jgi:hypothetical protein